VSAAKTPAEKIVHAVQTAISELPPGSILSRGDAYHLAHSVARFTITGDATRRAGPESERLIRQSLLAAYGQVRQLVASQLMGMTWQDVVAAVEGSVSRFLGKAELEIVPKPTMAYSGECEPHDVWNLMSNGYRVESRLKQEPSLVDTERDVALSKALARALQMLLFVSGGEVLQEDIDGKPYDGGIRVPQPRAPRLSPFAA
jgi:hypothetical protein